MSTTLHMTRSEIIAAIDRVARIRLGTSAAELVDAYRTGRLADPGLVGDALVLADLLDPTDRLKPSE
jgi:hypothetical protein